METFASDIIKEDLDFITQTSKSDLERICNSHLVLTGASGFIGKWLTLSYLHARRETGGNGRIVLVCRNIEPLRQLLDAFGFHEGFEFLEADVRRFPEGVIKDSSLVIHAATPASATLNTDDPLEMFDIIVAGQKKILEVCAKKKAVRVLFLSSGAIYGIQPMDLVGFPENWIGAPDITKSRNAYHEGKRVAEMMGFTYSKLNDFEFISARLFAFLAPFLPLDEHFAAGNFVRDVVDGRKIVIKSGGGSIRSYLYATDMCRGLWSLLSRGVSGEAYNLGSEVEISILNLAKEVVRNTATDLGVSVLGVDTIENVSRYVPDISKIKNISGEIHTTSLELAIQRTYRWARESRKNS